MESRNVQLSDAYKQEGHCLSSLSEKIRLKTNNVIGKNGPERINPFLNISLPLHFTAIDVDREFPNY